MKLKLDVDPDLVALMAAEVAAGERAVTAAMRVRMAPLPFVWRPGRALRLWRTSPSAICPASNSS